MRFLKSNSYKEVVAVSLPLVLSMGSITFMEFTDRVFLGNYSLDALAAATPAGITSFLFTAFFLGVVGYVNVFIAQYTGSGSSDGVGASLWQGIYFTLFATFFMVLLSRAAVPIFRFIGHDPGIQSLEAAYFRILCLGTGAMLLGDTLSCFYSGRGLTKVVMLIHMAGTLFNIPLDYAMINGVWGFPEMGIHGAALATVISWCFILMMFVGLVFTKENNERFSVWRGRKFDGELFMRLMKYGIPGGVQFFLDILAFTFFILIVGRLGTEELAVTNLVMSINSLAYMPMFGFSIGVSTLVGQAIGGDRPDSAVDAATSTAHIAMAYIFFLTLLFVFFPEPLIRLFLSDSTTPEQMHQILDTGVVLLRFVAVYLFFDSLTIVYTGVLKGAGDTRFIMWSMSLTILLVLLLPVYLGVVELGMGLYYSWSCITIYIMCLSVLILMRYNHGKWKEMKIIEN